MLAALLNARVLTPDEELAATTVVVRDGRIEAVGVGLPPPAGEGDAQVSDSAKILGGGD